MGHYESALTTIAAVGGVIWTGGLVVLQLRAEPPNSSTLSAEVMARVRARTEGVQVGMALAAFGSLVPIGALFLPPALLRWVYGLVAAWYLVDTWRCPVQVRFWLRQVPPERGMAWVNVGYFLPTLGLIALSVFPNMFLCAFLSASAILLAYNVISYTLRGATRDRA